MFSVWQKCISTRRRQITETQALKGTTTLVSAQIQNPEIKLILEAQSLSSNPSHHESSCRLRSFGFHFQARKHAPRGLDHDNGNIYKSLHCAWMKPIEHAEVEIKVNQPLSQCTYLALVIVTSKTNSFVNSLSMQFSFYHLHYFYI